MDARIIHETALARFWPNPGAYASCIATVLFHSFRSPFLRDAARTRIGRSAGSIRPAVKSGADHEIRLSLDPEFANWRGPYIFLVPGEELAPEVYAALHEELSFDFVNDRALLFGSPEQVAEKVIRLHEETGIERVVFRCG